MMSAINPLTAGAVILATAATDAMYVMFTSAVVAKRRLAAATWSSIWYMLSSFAVISYTESWVYVLFAAVGSWIGAFASMTYLHRSPGGPPVGAAPEWVPTQRLYQSHMMASKRLDAPQQLPYLRRRDTSPQREACYLEG
jgi:uncharacterized membrane protein YhaH (DUF805 family)